MFRKWGKGIFLFFLIGTLVVIPSAAFAKDKANPTPKAPAFPKKGIWLNTYPLTHKVFREKLTLVYFWDYASINCVREIGILKKWHELYSPYGLELILIHAPEFEFGKDKKNVEEALKRFKISFPVFLDNDFKLWDAYKIHSWPTKFLIDDRGKIVHTQIGEGQHLGTELQIREWLARINPGSVLPDPAVKDAAEKFDFEQCGMMSSETYTGYRKAYWWGSGISNRRWVPPDRDVVFKDRGERAEGLFVEGVWSTRQDYLEHARQTKSLTDYLGLVYMAHEVYAMVDMSGADKAGGLEAVAKIYVTRDEGPVPHEQRGIDMREDEYGSTYFMLSGPRLYYLITNEDVEPHELKLWTQSAGVDVHSFSFSNRCLSDFEHL